MKLLFIQFLLVLLANQVHEAEGNLVNTTETKSENEIPPCTPIPRFKLWPKSSFRQRNRTEILPNYIFYGNIYPKKQTQAEHCSIDFSDYVKGLITRRQEHNAVDVAHILVSCQSRKMIKVTFKTEGLAALTNRVLGTVFMVQLQGCLFNASNLVDLRRNLPFVTLFGSHIALQEPEFMSEALRGLVSTNFINCTNFMNYLTPNCCAAMAEAGFEDMSLFDLPDSLQQAMPNLQSLTLRGNVLNAPPQFPWNTIENVLPYMLERNDDYNIDYGKGLDVAPYEFNRDLDLSFNQIRNLTTPLSGKVTYLVLSNNNMEWLVNNSFWGLQEVQSIDISMNKLQSLPSVLLKGLFSLKRFTAHHNELTTLPTGLFDDAANLIEVDFQFNKIVKIQPETFCCGNLETVKLSHNMLTTFKSDMFCTIPESLLYLELAYNQFRELPLYPLMLRRLLLLNLTSNLITFDSTSSFLDSFDDTEMTHIFVSSWSSSKYPQQHLGNIQIDLRDNLISKISISTEASSEDKNIEHITKWRLLFSIFSFNVDNNPRTCDCNFLPFIDQWKKYNITVVKREGKIRERIGSAFNFDRPQHLEWECQKPHFNARSSVVSLEREQFYCSYPDNRYCPPQCDCWQNVLSEVFVDCSNKSLKSVPENAPLGTTRISLNNNTIRNLEGFSYFRNLTEIKASSSHIEDIDDTFFSSLTKGKIKSVDLRKNSIQSLPRSVETVSIPSLQLSSNKLRCDCNNLWMRTWLRSVSEKKTSEAWDPNDLRCTTGRDTVVQITYAAEEDFSCPDDVLVTAVASSLSVVFVVTTVIAILAYIYRVEIKILMFAKFNWHPFDKLDEDDTKEFDAFISYSSFDLAWVRNSLLQNLESQTPPYRTCVHDRDFKVGVPIDTNIMQAVSSSRRMILVLSRSFLASEWCKLEFRMAHERVLKERQKYLIVVLLEDLNLNEMEQGLSAYLRTNTYLHVDNKWFWKKLLYSMPTRKVSPVVSDDNEMTSL